ncbi:MAG: P1 family peptidase, partial [Hyphomonas sp.]|nr:P1 family peptidase [Hyphomonas sp.]
SPMQAEPDTDRVRARELGIAPGILPTGEKNDITDVAGVRVGHVTLIEGNDIRTGATAILPHDGNLYQSPVPAAVFVGNGYGKLAGISQIAELGEIETPIVLTNTLSVDRAMSAVIDWTLDQPGNERVRSVNAVVGETNDSGLNNIRKRVLTPDMIREAITSASAGPVQEGAVGAGAGTIAFGWKGGIGSSSRHLPESLGGFTVGVLVQSNFGGILQVDGAPVGERLGQYYLKDEIASDKADGSIMVVIATDAPLSSRNLERLSKRAIAGLARTGASMTNGSGDYVIAFSTYRQTDPAAAQTENDNMSPLFQATIEATEEAIYNSLFMAKTVDGFDVSTQSPRRVEALPLDKVKDITGVN